jgi:hypothetical protein
VRGKLVSREAAQGLRDQTSCQSGSSDSRKRCAGGWCHCCRVALKLGVGRSSEVEATKKSYTILRRRSSPCRPSFWSGAGSLRPLHVLSRYGRDAPEYVKEHYLRSPTHRDTHVHGPEDGFLITQSTVLSRWRRKTACRSSPKFATPSSQATS